MLPHPHQILHDCHKKRLVSSLKEMTNFPILLIEILGIGQVYRFHDFRDRDRGGFNQ